MWNAPGDAERDTLHRPGGGRHIAEPFAGGGAPGSDDVPGAEHVGDLEDILPADLVAEPCDPLPVEPEDRDHRSRAGLGTGLHRPAADSDEADGIVEVDRAGKHQPPCTPRATTRP